MFVADVSGFLYVWDMRKVSEVLTGIDLELGEYLTHIEINGETFIGVTNKGKLVLCSVNNIHIEPIEKTVVVSLIKM